MKKVLVTGGSGMLGKDILAEFNSDPKYQMYSVDLKNNQYIDSTQQFVGDLMDPDFTLSVINKVKPDIIIHCAAIVNLQSCEENKPLANGIHVGLTKQLASYQSGKTKFIYISTDSVFDGKKGNYNEEDEPTPLNYYAKSKYKGEIACIENNKNHMIIRTNIFGFNQPLKNSLAEWAIDSFQQQKPISGFTDIVFNAIYTKHLAIAIHKLLEQDFTGLINIASKNSLSKFDFIKLIVQGLKQNKELIKPIMSDDIVFSIPRPKVTDLNTTKAQKIISLPTIEEGIMDMINDYNT
jgi:dTDP-4-dehydrorhamnose reductase